MKLKVKETFKDKYTGEVYEEGKIIDVKKERGEELLKSPYVVVEENKPATKNNKDNKDNNTEEPKTTVDSAEQTEPAAENNENV